MTIFSRTWNRAMDEVAAWMLMGMPADRAALARRRLPWFLLAGFSVSVIINLLEAFSDHPGSMTPAGIFFFTGIFTGIGGVACSYWYSRRS